MASANDNNDGGPDGRAAILAELNSPAFEAKAQLFKHLMLVAIEESHGDTTFKASDLLAFITASLMISGGAIVVIRDRWASSPALLEVALQEVSRLAAEASAGTELPSK